MFHWLMHSWETVKDCGITVYQCCPVCGKRRAWQRPGGIQPIDRQWVLTGQWTERGPAPKGGSGTAAPLAGATAYKPHKSGWVRAGAPKGRRGWEPPSECVIPSALFDHLPDRLGGKVASYANWYSYASDPEAERALISACVSLAISMDDQRKGGAPDCAGVGSA